MEGLIQTLVGMGPLKIIGLVVFILVVVAVVKAGSSPNNMPGGPTSGGTGKTGTGTTTPTDTTQNQQ